MQIIRTIVWVLLTIVMVAFIAINWTPEPVNFWPLANGNYIHVNWPIGVVVLVSFLLGLAPMWLLHKTAAWRLRRRIGTLENSVRAASVSVPVESPAPAPAPAPVKATTEPPFGTL